MIAQFARTPGIERPGPLTAFPGFWWRVISAMVAVCFGTHLYAQSAATTQLLHRTFVDKDFVAKSYGPVVWLKGGKSYATVEPSGTEGSADIVRYDTETGQREILVSGQKLVASDEKKPISIEDYALSDDLNRVLIFTNSRRVWRRNTRGDYWVFERDSRALKKLGNGGPPSTLMFAKFSPDGRKVAYVRFNNIFVEDLETGEIARLTTDGSEKIVNGTSDWVYEEEFELRDGLRWSPDGTHIAYWQFDTTPVKTFALIYDTGAPYKIVTHIPYPDFGVYPTVRQIPYPEPGTPNSSVRIGVIPSIGRRNSLDRGSWVRKRQLHCAHGVEHQLRINGATASQPSAEYERRLACRRENGCSPKYLSGSRQSMG
jgi:dipeptidyl aminopeptidase/acylaminoacyl peptidase